MIPTDADERKNVPVYSGFMAYFPHAICEVAKLSKRGNEQHNPGTKLHWDRSKSKDEQDACARHMLGQTIAEGYEDKLEHATAQAWRAMANLEKLCEELDSFDRHTSTTARKLFNVPFENSKPQKIPSLKMHPVVGANESAEERRDRIIEAARVAARDGEKIA